MTFDQLPAKQQERARAMFLNARSGDGYLYELGITGDVLCRRKSAPQTKEGAE